MLEHAYSPLTRILLLLGVVLASAVLPAQAKDSVYSRTTIVVYNKNFPGSDTVASHYVTQRSIPSGNRVSLDCPATEEISRADFRKTIEIPLQRIFADKGWWKVKQVGNQRRITENKVHVIVLAHGIPLKIKDSRPAGANSSQTGKLQSDAASVDSELALLGQFNDRLNGWQPNPYFQEEMAFGDFKRPDLMLVGRLDGPDVSSCRRLIDDASAVERTGLWGRAYIDLAQKTNQGSELGENWLKSIIAQCDRDGIANVVDTHASTFPHYYPMDDAALYFGWYTPPPGHANGPFLNPDFRLQRGAVACHIQSYSAVTVRSKKDRWVGPLIDKGAAAALGNVYEPFLQATTHLDLFFRRLLDGYTVAEAAYMATPKLSWMSVLVGDPLYRPFDGFRTYEPQFYREDEQVRFKTYHVATKLWANESFKYDGKLEAASKNHKTGFYYEALAGRQRNINAINGAISLLAKAKTRYITANDRLRVDLQIVELERHRNNKEKALALLREMNTTSVYKNLDGFKTVTALLNQLDPPGPAGL